MIFRIFSRALMYKKGRLFLIKIAWQANILSGILIFSIIGLVSLTAFIIYRTHLTNKLKQLSEEYQKQTDLVNELTHFRSIDSHSIQELTNLVSSCKSN